VQKCAHSSKDHVFGIPDLDLSAEPLAGPWFRLGACGAGSGWSGVASQRYVSRSSSSGYRAPCIEIFEPSAVDFVKVVRPHLRSASQGLGVQLHRIAKLSIRERIPVIVEGEIEAASF
jgi:hypothetical protein